MANYIKIPLPSNPPRPLDTTDIVTSITQSSDNYTPQAATATAFTTDGSGFDGLIDLTIDGGGIPTVVDVTNAGEGYAVGDTLTFSTTVIGGTEDLIITLVAADLFAGFDGSITDTFRSIPVESVAFVQPSSITEAVIVTSNWDAGVAAAMAYTVTMMDWPVTTGPHLVADLAEAVNTASQAENSIPTVQFDNDASCISVVLA
jgi:hypothetical protein